MLFNQAIPLTKSLKRNQHTMDGVAGNIEETPNAFVREVLDIKLAHRRVVVCISGGKASAWCADYALSVFPAKSVVLYFNDTKWEHPDTYRFLADLSKYWGHEIVQDSDGRSPEDLFKEHHALANNRMPFCSRILKAERLQRFYCDGDVLVFGIGRDEQHRADRIRLLYDRVASKSGRRCSLLFPLISAGITKDEINEWLMSTEIQEPELYRHGFAHNNCAGGCVRAGKRQWALLCREFPEIYAERERIEQEMRDSTGKDIAFLKDETLRHLRERIVAGAFDDQRRLAEERKEASDD